MTVLLKCRPLKFVVMHAKPILERFELGQLSLNTSDCEISPREIRIGIPEEAHWLQGSLKIPVLTGEVEMERILVGKPVIMT